MSSFQSDRRDRGPTRRRVLGATGGLLAGITAGCLGDDGSVEANDLDDEDIVVERVADEAATLFCFDAEAGDELVVRVEYDGDEAADFGLRPTGAEGPSFEEEITDTFEESVDVPESAEYCGNIDTEDGGTAQCTIWLL